MLLIAGSIRIDPDARVDLIQAAIEVARELRKQVGCARVLLSADLEDASLLYLLQTWESQDALTANLKSRRIDAIRNQVGKLGVREMALSKYEVAEVDPAFGTGGPEQVWIHAGLLRIDPARRDAIFERARATMAIAREDPGCLAFAFSADLEDPTVLHFFQEWQSEDAQRAHVVDSRVEALRAQIGALGVREVVVERYRIGAIGPIA